MLKCAALALTALTLLACRQEAPNSPILLRIDDQTITREQYKEALFEAEAASFYPKFVERTLVERAAKEAGVTVSPEALEQALQAEVERILLERYEGQRTRLEQQLANAGLDYATWLDGRRRDLKWRLIVEALLQVKVDDARVQTLFEQRFGPGGVDRDLRVAFFSTEPDRSKLYTPEQYQAELPQETAAARAQAEALRQRLMAGEDFAALAKLYSDDQSAAAGGSLDVKWANRFGGGFDQAVASLSPGQISEVVEGRRGFHLIEVTGIRRGARYQGRAIFIEARRQGERPDDEAPFLEALARAQAIERRLKAGESFATVAATESSDTASRARGGDLGRFTPGRLGPTVDPVLETLELGRLSPPVRVAEGFVLVQLESREFVPAEDLKQVRHLLISTEYQATKRRKLSEGLEARARQAADELIAAVQGGADFAELVRQRSEDEPSAQQSGRLDRYRPGRLELAVDEALPGMRLGELKRVQGKRGFYVVSVIGERKTELSQVRDELVKDLQTKRPSDAEVKAYVDKLKKRARVQREGPLVTP